jgi:hypothetical protein
MPRHPEADLARAILSILQPLLSRLSRNLLVLADVHGEAMRWRAGPACAGQSELSYFFIKCSTLNWPFLNERPN